MNEEEKKTIEKFIEKCYKYDESVEIKGISVGEEYRMLNTVCKALNLIEKLQKENEELNYKLHSKKIALEIYNRYIPKSKLKEKKEAIINEMVKHMEQDIEEMKRLFYADRLTAYGKRKLIEYYEQRIKQLEEENQLLLNSKIGVDLSFDDYIPVSLVEETIGELNKAYEDSKDENGESEYYYPDYTIRVLEELLEKRE